MYKLKRRKVHSVQRCYENEHGLYDQNGEINFFKIFSDTQVGFTKNWQSQIKQTDMDDDVETDEDQLYAAMRHVKNELRDGNFYWNKKGSKTIRNMYRYSHLVNRPKINKSVA